VQALVDLTVVLGGKLLHGIMTHRLGHHVLAGGFAPGISIDGGRRGKKRGIL
jgi:hypothetical protein